MKIGTKVKVTPKAIRWYRKHLLEIYGPNGLFDFNYAEEAMMWAMADLDTPRGKVRGRNSYGDIHVSLENDFGATASLYMSPTELMQIARKKKETK